MDTRDLMYLVVIAEERSISKAAERLYIAQPTLSQFLNKFEKEIGSQLFIRMGRGIRPTYAGAELLQYARHMLADYHRMQNKLHDIEALNAGRILFGISPYRGAGLFPPILKRFNELHPAIDLEIIEDNSLALEKLIATGKLDMALTASNSNLMKVEYVPFIQDEVVVIANKEHPILQEAHTSTHNKNFPYVTFDSVMNYGFLLGKSNTILGQIATKEFAKSKKRPHIISRNLHAYFAAALAAHGVGLALTYRSCNTHSTDVALLSLGDAGYYVDLFLVYPQNNYKSKAVQALTKIMFEIQKEVDYRPSP